MLELAKTDYCPGYHYNLISLQYANNTTNHLEPRDIHRSFAPWPSTPTPHHPCIVLYIITSPSPFSQPPRAGPLTPPFEQCPRKVRERLVHDKPPPPSPTPIPHPIGGWGLEGCGVRGVWGRGGLRTWGSSRKPW